jgi:hydroxymethylglutaryl-CoA lyase
MANSPKILEHILLKSPSSKETIVYQFLVPNEKGMNNLLSTYNKPPQNAPPTSSSSPGLDRGSSLNTSQDPNEMPASANQHDSNSRPGSTCEQAKPEIEVSIFTAATETFTQKNTNCSITESLDRFKPVFQKSKENNLKVRAYISVALGCPYEGPDVDPKKVAELAVNLLEMGSDEISVADTTGMGTAPRTKELLRTLAAAGIESKDLALHFHDTFGQALVNTVVGLEAGIRTFDCAVAGLGGCPYSPGATGNVASEDLVYLFENLGLRTGVDLVKLAEIGEWIAKEVGKPNESHAGRATLARLRRDR